MDITRLHYRAADTTRDGVRYAVRTGCDGRAPDSRTGTGVSAKSFARWRQVSPCWQVDRWRRCGAEDGFGGGLRERGLGRGG